MNKIKNLLVAFFCLSSFLTFAQESGSFKKNPKINVKSNAGLQKDKKKEDEELGELPKLQFRNEVESYFE